MRRRRTLVVICAIALPWFIMISVQGRKNRSCVLHLENAGAQARYHISASAKGRLATRCLEWLRTRFRVDLIDYVYALRMNSCTLTNRDWECATRLNRIVALELTDTNISGPDLVRLTEFKRLVWLSLAGCEI